MELIIENLISFFNNEYSFYFDGANFNSETIIRGDPTKYCFCGVDAIDLVDSLEREFNVSFEDFDIYRYFYSEGELGFSWSILLGFTEQRRIEKELTVQMLFDYMIKNVKKM